VTASTRWCRITIVRHDGTLLGRYFLDGVGAPGLHAVDTVARLALAAKRRGARVTCSDVSPALRELLELGGLVVEVPGQTERGEETLWIES
jgi:hypothetical protein